MLNQLVSLAFGWHSDLRWPLLALACFVIVRSAWLWKAGGVRRRFDRALLIAFAVLMTVQGVLGLVVLIGFAAMGAGLPLARALHSIVTTVAIVISYQFMSWDGASGVTQSRNCVLMTAGALGVAFAGMLLLPGGLDRVTAM